MNNRTCGLILILLSLCVIPFSVRAQTGLSARLSSPIIASFPKIESYLDVKDPQGKFLHGLQSNQIEVIEDGKSLPVTSLEEIRSGVQLVVALNPGPTFGVRNSQAISRYDYIKEALRNWAISRQGSTIDDLSLLITDGPAISHVSDSTEWLRTLAVDQIDARTAIPQFDTLFRAVTIASDSPSRLGMGRAILFVTPPIEEQDEQSLENLLAQSEQEKIPIFIWMVTSPGSYSAQSLDFLEQIANQTGGQFFIYTGEESLPNPEDYLEPLRYSYLLSYGSAIKSSGNHELSVRIQFEGENIDSNVQNFNLDILPPEPAFVAPPLQIQRTLVSSYQIDEVESQSQKVWEPQKYDLQVIFDFPDGRKRALVKSSLLVDGVVVDENTVEPFDEFSWDISEYQIDGAHKMQVQITDVLGLTGSSIEIPVQITVEAIRNNPWSTVQKNIPFMIALIILLVGAIIFLLLIMGKRLKPSPFIAKIRQSGDSIQTTGALQIQPESTTNIFPGWISRLGLKQRKLPTQTDALLVPISNSDHSHTLVPIPIASDLISIGSDPDQATIALEDLSVECVHTQIKRDQENLFHIIDQGSIAGTWVNYVPIENVTRLEHGDLIHIGRIGFVFTMRDPTKMRKPIITPELSPEDGDEN